MPLFFWFDLSLEARAEISEIFCCYFGTNDYFIRTFWNYLTFSFVKQNFGSETNTKVGPWFRLQTNTPLVQEKNTHILSVVYEWVLWSHVKNSCPFLSELFPQSNMQSRYTVGILHFFLKIMELCISINTFNPI